jgi:mono/diheme cytochrome c family protein
MKKIILLAALFGLVATLSSQGAEAKENWNTQCAKCHGADGKSDTKIGAKLGAKDFTDAKVQADLKDDAAVKAITDGIKDADGKTKMKAYVTGADTPLTDGEIKALVAYVRGLKT